MNMTYETTQSEPNGQASSPPLPRPKVSDDLQAVVESHPVGYYLTALSYWLGTGCDLISFTVYLTLMCGALRQNFQLVLESDDLTLDKKITDRVARICPQRVRHLTKYEKKIAHLSSDYDLLIFPPSVPIEMAGRILEEQAVAGSENEDCVASLVLRDRGVLEEVAGARLILQTQKSRREVKGFGSELKFDFSMDS